MTDAAAHLRALAVEARPAGSEAAARARRYCNSILESEGFAVVERPFEYSALPGMYGTPLGGLVALLAIAGGAFAGAEENAAISLVVLVGGALALFGTGRWVARRGVLALPVLRRRGVNLEATRGAGAPTLWLVAHVDSKSQPVPLVARAVGIMLLAVAWIAAMAMAAIQLSTSGLPAVEWRWVVIAGVIGALPVLASTVGDRSAGAVDNASGVATVLAAAALLPPTATIGVLISDGEELGLAGARAWCRDRQPGSAINVDGVDDAGLLTLMWTRPRAPQLERAVRAAADAEAAPLRLIRLIPGVLVDAVALADAGWRVVTISHGDIGTLRRIHTSLDSASVIDGAGVELAARLLARATTSLLERA